MARSTAFSLFADQTRPSVVAALGGAGATRREVTLETAARWKALGDAERAVFIARAAEEKQLDDDGSSGGREPAASQAPQAPPPPAIRPSSWHPPISELKRALLAPGAGALPAAQRMRAIYYLRSLADGTGTATAVLSAALTSADINPPHSPLLRHEMAYVLGQLRDAAACDALERTLADGADDVMVRHECAEALGAIGSPRSLPLLRRLAAPGDATADVEIRQTCEVAWAFCNWKASGAQARGLARPAVACACMLAPYSSHDPAPPDPATDALSTAAVGARLRDASLPLFERYGAMFALRNRGGSDSVVELGLALTSDTSSALLRHEVAFVLGQMQHPTALDALAEALLRAGEHSMVRHEAAEALGSLEFDTDTDDGARDAAACRLLLEKHASEAHEDDGVVRESCEVALDATDYYAAMSEAAITGATSFKTQKNATEHHFNIKQCVA